ncbi:DUF6386 family protein [Variovorax paradoxus]|uniref:DUF6386 family protein n=1 Tax=Variovorax paradoxus TaxID=34073 RepID=UPI002786DE05|nr:DUF6386 family protein [Variovorax paradoxus]MDP9933518.1 hypothetical protein [Variovorax paradoxus]
MKMKEFSFSTDTATLCVFDPSRLKHRLNDDADWWTTSDDELIEVNKGNVAFFGLGSDGTYRVSFAESPLPDSAHINVQVSSGRVFIGAGEEVTSGGLEPEGLRGVFVDLAAGSYTVAVKREGSLLTVVFMPGEEGCNDFSRPVFA